MIDFLKGLIPNTSEKRDTFLVGAAAMGLITYFGTNDLSQSFGILFLLIFLVNINWSSK